MVVFAPDGEPSNAPLIRPRLSPAVKPTEDLTTAGEEASFLLRQFQDGIGAWTDLFDHNLSYQTLLMREIPSSPLLMHAVCSLAGRQLALISGDPVWNTKAEQHYGKSLALLRDGLDAEGTQLSHTLPASILLLSYELMSMPGQDYTRHFMGAKLLIESSLAAGRSSAAGQPLFCVSY